MYKYNMNTFYNFKLWLEEKTKKTFNSVKDGLIIQIHPIKIKNDKEINQKRIGDFDADLLRSKITDWTMFEDLSYLAKDQINKIFETRNGTLADIINIIVSDHSK